MPLGEHSRRPWGEYLVLSDESDHKVKRLTVSPGLRLSYQRHAQRSEHWYIVSGSGILTLDGAEVPIAAGQAADIPVGTAHRVHNTGEVPLVLIEVQSGTYFGEDDIERLEDDFGRIPTP